MINADNWSLGGLADFDHMNVFFVHNIFYVVFATIQIMTWIWPFDNIEAAWIVTGGLSE